MTRFVLVLVLIAAGIGAAVALRPSNAPNATPEGAVHSIYAAVEQHDMAALTALLPPTQRDAARADWERQRTAFDPALRMQLDLVLNQLSAPNAEENLLQIIRPNLRTAQDQLRQAGTFLPLALQHAPIEQRADLGKLMQATQTWLNGIDLTDETRLRKALGAVCGAVRATGVRSAADLSTLDFDALLAKADTALGGMFGLLAAYGLDLPAICRSVEVGTPAIDGDHAKVPVTATVFGQRISGSLDVQRLDGRWYPQSAVSSPR